MPVESTDKVWFRPRANIFERAENDRLNGLNSLYDPTRSDLSDQEFFDIIFYAPEYFVFELAINCFLSTEQLNLLLEYNMDVDTTHLGITHPVTYFFFNIVAHGNVSPEILANIYEACKTEPRILCSVAENVLTPSNVLKKLLPSKESVEGNFKGFENFEYEAVVNPSTPVLDALHASQWLNDFAIQFAWENRYDELTEFLQTSQGLKVKDYPLEWVQELLWGRAVK